jgi:uncharacterized protein
MKIALIGATGRIGRHIALAAAQAGHACSALVRAADASLPAGTARVVDLFEAGALEAAIAGQDAVVSAFGSPDDAPLMHEVAAALVRAARATGVRRIVLIGAVSVLEAASGQRVEDTPDFPQRLLAKARSHARALDILQREAQLDWTFFCPPMQIGPGEGRGSYRFGAGSLIVDAAGVSAISYTDFAQAVIAETVDRNFIRRVATVAY